MKAVAGVYDTHEKAVQAVSGLKQSGFSTRQVSIVGKADLVNNHIHVKSSDTAEKVEVSVGVVAGAALGILTGVGIFAIPGLGFLYGAGALVGAFAGFDFGLMAGGLTAALTHIGMDKVSVEKYEKHLNEGKFIVFIQGNDKDLEKAQKLLHTENLHVELDSNIPLAPDNVAGSAI
jgi:uncharacterized membrane protein